MHKLLKRLTKYFVDLVLDILCTNERELEQHKLELSHSNMLELSTLTKELRERYSELYREDVKRLSTEYRYYFTKIPNDEQHRNAITLLRRYLSSERRLRLRGRGTRQFFGNQSYIDLEHAETIAIYIDKKLADSYRIVELE